MNKEEKKKFKFGDFFKYVKFTYQYAREQKGYLFLFLFLNILGVIVSVIVPVLAAQRLVKLTDNLWGELFIVIFSIFAFEILRNILRDLCSFAVNKYFYDVRKNIQLELAKETLKITTNDLNINSSGVFIERINNDSNQVTDIYITLVDYGVSIIGDLGVFISVFFISKSMFLLYFIFIIILFLIQKRSANINYEFNKVIKKKREKVSGFTSELVRGAKDIKILNAESSFVKKADELITDVNTYSYNTFRVKSKLRLINGNVRDLLDLLCGLISAYLLMTNQLTLAQVLIILNYQGKIMGISTMFEKLLEEVKSFDLSASRIYGVLVGGEFSKEEFGSNSLDNIKGDIKFENVDFCYEENNKILKNMSFNIEANKTVAFVGKSGAGKSTIFNLISALYHPTKGNIYLDGININELSREAIRGNLSIISQSPYIYNLTIKENLQIIKSDATEAEMIKACKMACLHEFIMSLKDGYDTVVGEGGVTLSGGQKQRLAIARAFLLGTKIILFDEATSALDNETQANIQKAITNMKGDYTVLIIAHRLSTVLNADKICVVDNGKIVDEGTHKELLKNSKVFKKLYETELGE